METIKLLNNEWQYDAASPLGPEGGFGAVFAGYGNGEDVAVKRLHLKANDLAHRELRISENLILRTLANVMPVLDSGKDANSDYYFIVMPRADKSLQQELMNARALDELEAIQILLQIAMGLNEVKDIVHRDLKPGNILYHENQWKIADFGIARFVEESTSPNTLKGFLSKQYAAPEQWDNRHANSATDIYALGCIAYTLLTGKPPFLGPQQEDYRQQHVTLAPPNLDEKFNPRLRSLISSMLRKPQSARPDIDRVIKVLADISSASGVKGEPFMELAMLGAIDAAKQVASDAAYNEEEQNQRLRNELKDTAIGLLKEIVGDLAKVIKDAASTSTIIHDNQRLLRIDFGAVSMQIEAMHNGNQIQPGVFKESGWDVIAGAIIILRQLRPTTYIWSANLWYTNLGEGETYRWWEVMYMTRPSLRTREYEPFAVDYRGIVDADLAAARTISNLQFAARPRPIDDEDFEGFCKRWVNLMTKGYQGRLERPRYLPLD
jgi:serine/threonine protein kinase